MILFKKAIELHKYLEQQRKNGKITGFVPTMGALHQGHISLIKEAKIANEICIASIFVNPTQFNDPSDYQHYPVTIEKDITMLEAADCDVLFLPSVAEIYPDGTDQNEHYELGRLEDILEGKYRPGHFQGVCRVMHRLLDIVRPDHLYLGQKDYQQCMVISRLLQLIGMQESVHVHISPTLRETDGLAMSSRNMRLSNEAREIAPSLYQSLLQIRKHLKKGDLREIKLGARTFLREKGFKVDYTEIAEANSLQPVSKWDGRQKLVALTAATIGDVRLIDNLLLI